MIGLKFFGFRICAGIENPSLVGMVKSSGVCSSNSAKSSDRDSAIRTNSYQSLVLSESAGSVPMFEKESK